MSTMLCAESLTVGQHAAMLRPMPKNTNASTTSSFQQPKSITITNKQACRHKKEEKLNEKWIIWNHYLYIWSKNKGLWLVKKRVKNEKTKKESKESAYQQQK